MSRRLLVIFNPTAGGGRKKRFQAVVAALEGLGCTVDLAATTCGGDAERMAREADLAAYDAVVAAGGDGTINEVINGLAGRDLPLAVIPLGTANVLAREIGLSGNPLEIARVIAGAEPRRVHVGLAGGRRFAIMLGAGFDARVVENIDLKLKRATGKLAYVVGTLVQLLRYRPQRYRVVADEGSYDAAQVVVAKGHFYGGGFVVAPDARLGSPRFEVVLFERHGRSNVLRYATAMLFGWLPRLDDVRVVPATQVTITGQAGETVQADGDRFCLGLPLKATIDPLPLRLIGAV